MINELILFYLVYLGQVALLSYFLPKMLYRRLKYVIDTYPPAKYPKFYTSESADVAEWKWRALMRFLKVFSSITLVFGLGLLSVALLNNYSTYDTNLEAIVITYTIFQLIPMLVISVSEFKQYKSMRASNVSTKRKTELVPRRLFDFISPIFVVIALLLIAANISFDIYIADISPEDNSDLLFKILTTNFVHIYFACFVTWYLYGKKQDPYQSHKDHKKFLNVVVKIAVYGSIAATIFFFSDTAVEHFDVAHFDPLLMSLYFQIIIWFTFQLVLKGSPIEDINFEVYKADTITSQ
ncbi:MAG: hypothetical protein COA74_09055 [Gammaproteobacteria bacterium]|nr:MAG: hypothetical protein COA74_09055 [Gammaproteobacteria bacterium]